jgi:hypothetical protein
LERAKVERSLRERLIGDGSHMLEDVGRNDNAKWLPVRKFGNEVPRVTRIPLYSGLSYSRYSNLNSVCAEIVLTTGECC